MPTRTPVTPEPEGETIRPRITDARLLLRNIRILISKEINEEKREQQKMNSLFAKGLFMSITLDRILFDQEVHSLEE